jgi:transposase
MARMRGDDRQPRAMFSYVSAEERVPQEHPLRAIRAFVDEILREMTREFDALYALHGRPSIPPERLLRAQLLQLFYSIRSERLLMEQLDYNILFRWFVGLEMDEPIWVPTVFTKNRDRLLQHAVAHSFFRRVVSRATDLMSDEHFTVDGTLLEAWASQKSFQRKDGGTDGDGRDFRGEERKNDTHASVPKVEQRGGAPGVSGSPADGESPRLDCGRAGDGRRRVRRTRGRDVDAECALAVCAEPAPHGGGRQSL